MIASAALAPDSAALGVTSSTQQTFTYCLYTGQGDTDMSKETIQWLNENVLMGDINDKSRWANNGYVVAAKGETVQPWHAMFGDFKNGFDGPVPIERVEQLFSFPILEKRVKVLVPCDGMENADTFDKDGVPHKYITLSDRKVILRGDTHEAFGVFKSGYTVHGYHEWLVNNVATILDDELHIESAGLLKQGAVAWVSVSLPESVTTEADFIVRPKILAFTSLNGQFSTTYMRASESPVCDNSLDLEIRGADDEQVVKTKHSARSFNKVGDAREALRILYQDSEASIEFFDKLARWEITNKAFGKVLNMIEPMPEQKVSDGKVTNQRALTMADSRRQDIAQMWVRDPRVAPWKGTALGVLQAFNTYDQHVRQVKGQRVERQMLNTISGKTGQYDQHVLETLAQVEDVELRDMVGV